MAEQVKDSTNDEGISYRASGDRQDLNTFSPQSRPDRSGGGEVHSAVCVENIVTDTTEFLLMDELSDKPDHGSKGQGDMGAEITGVGATEYPGAHNEQARFGSGAGI